jgi:hypothetical protein
VKEWRHSPRDDEVVETGSTGVRAEAYYDHYKTTGVLPYYHSDIQGVFEVANRPDGHGKCAQAVVKFSNTKTPLDGLTVLGDAMWKD